MKKQNMVIIGVVAFILAVAVGYALFSETITINGTATAKGSFDYEFTSIGDITKVGYTATADEDETTPAEIAVISSDKNTLTVTVNKLDYPGAYVEIPVTVTNVGTISGKLESISETGIKDEDTVLQVSYSGIAASDTVMNTGDTNEMTIRVEWPSDHELAEGENSFEESVEFSIQLNYKQVNE